uniref:Uncharacterized protein n=1 Tax=Setaria italica TaxID=4555 RepID=K4AH43_SETIT
MKQQPTPNQPKEKGACPRTRRTRMSCWMTCSGWAGVRPRRRHGLVEPRRLRDRAPAGGAPLRPPPAGGCWRRCSSELEPRVEAEADSSGGRRRRQEGRR